MGLGGKETETARRTQRLNIALAIENGEVSP